MGPLGSEAFWDLADSSMVSSTFLRLPPFSSRAPLSVPFPGSLQRAPPPPISHCLPAANSQELWAQQGEWQDMASLESQWDLGVPVLSGGCVRDRGGRELLGAGLSRTPKNLA